MGAYQWTLVSLCGFGWLADNMWLEAIAIIMPRVQQHYTIQDNHIGALPSSMFLGMMIGAMGWGACADLVGRSTAFNLTLFFTAIFGIVASFVDSFVALCVVLFFLGSAVGGSMPTDGTLLMEHVPSNKRHMVTALSFFFSIGSVLAAVIALLIVPQHSCVPGAYCNVERDNQGWRYLLFIMGVLTFLMFAGRIVFFKLHESPRYLVHAGRPHDAVVALQKISRFNGVELALDLEDVCDHRGYKGDADAVLIHEAEVDSNSSDDARRIEECRSDEDRSDRGNGSEDSVLLTCLPSWIGRPLQGWWVRVALVLSPEWIRTTLLVWTIWCAMAMAFTLFNVFLPLLLETGSEKPRNVSATLWDVVVYTLGGCPGAPLGAWMVQSATFGRRWSLACSTFATALFCAVFALGFARIGSVGVGLASTTMWAVLYGWTPEIFSTKVRGTACGIASALSRIGGLIAPLVGGVLLAVGRAAPVYCSVAVFTFAGLCVMMLRDDGKDGPLEHSVH
ncbi:MFS general substrate transporter [Fistulina hepatica ATCC 64428]|uniref:MFS general substrate transporter n=1 Tax=Fistulina hepatica ATCC 64428 TaxID=1128425 RepID=A0A0D7AIY0_9AGAR|nr:MFS general substrate transporter [Fistulina hepatica ATCC 64428]